MKNLPAENFCQVAIISNQPKSIFDYKCQKNCKIGQIVKIPFKGSYKIGVILTKNPSEIPEDKIKEIHQYFNFQLASQIVTLINKLSTYYLTSVGKFLKSFLLFEPNSDAQIASKQIGEPALSILNQEQSKILEYINTSSKNKFLLEGVTGSGKTEIYLHLVAKELEKNMQALVLVPEIMLSNQMINRFTQKLGFQPDVWHSSISKAKKNQIWHKIISGHKCLILGARSAVFLPFQNLSLVVVDEEHDSSYKQDDNLLYNGRDVAVLLSHLFNAKLVLGSATPSIESLNNAKIGKYEHLQIKQKFSDTLANKIEIIDLRTQKLENGRSISPALLEEIKKTLADKSQVLLFLNRKGYAPISLCKSCGEKISCPDCSSYLVYHKEKNRLICHQCGYHQAQENSCKSCNASGSMITYGVGIEKLAEEVRELLPEAKTLTISSDSISHVKDAEKLLKEIAALEYEILIGTQILSKGLHFPRLNLVGVIDADIGATAQDLRATERSYQLMQQVSGRSGRETLGKVFIQTFNPQNSVIQALVTNEKNKLYEKELSIRKEFALPPFTRMIAIIVSSLDQKAAENYIVTLRKLAPAINNNVKILGPVEAPIHKIRNRYRFRMLALAPLNINIQKYVEFWLQQIKTPNKIRVKIDVDPYNFM